VGGARHARRPKCRRLPEAPASWLTRRWSATPSTRPSWRRQVSANAMGYTVCPYRSRPCSGISQRTDGRQDACSTSALGVAPGVEVTEQRTVPWSRSKVISFSRPYGTGFPWASFAPAMNCWAILTCPCRGGSPGNKTTDGPNVLGDQPTHGVTAPGLVGKEAPPGAPPQASTLDVRKQTR